MEMMHCIRLGAELNCNVAYFSLDEESPFIKKLSAEGKIVAVYENGFITIKRRMEDQDRTCHSCAFNTWWKSQIHDCKCSAATLASYVWGFKTEDISLSLQTFIPSAAQTPGRMNIFEFKNKVLMILHTTHLATRVLRSTYKV
jgi:cyanophycin synthetase